MPSKITFALLGVLLVVIIGLLGWHFMDRAKLQAQIAAAVAATTGAERQRDDAQALARRAQEANQANLATIAQLEQDRAQQAALVEAEAQRRAAIQSRYDALTTRYQEAIRDDPAIRDWASTPLPDAVASGRLLYHPAGSGGGDADGGAAPAGGDRVPANQPSAAGER